MRELRIKGARAVGCGTGCPLTTGGVGVAMPPLQIFFHFLDIKMAYFGRFGAVFDLPVGGL